MRIIAGEWRGRPLVAPKGDTTRPTSDRTRETLFSMLASRLGGFADLRVADLYAGSGALGLEAISRGAAHCTFVERAPEALAAIRGNARTLGAVDSIEVIACDAAKLPPRQPFQLIFADPPYAAGSGNAVVGAVSAAGWLAPKGWLAIETERRVAVDPGSLVIEAERDSGRARLTLLRSP